MTAEDMQSSEIIPRYKTYSKEQSSCLSSRFIFYCIKYDDLIMETYYL